MMVYLLSGFGNQEPILLSVIFYASFLVRWFFSYERMFILLFAIVLGIGGIIAFVMGSIILIDTEYEGYGVSILFISTFAIINALFLFFILTLVLKSRNKPIVSGSEELIGATGKITNIEDGDMWVSVHGENWKATSSQSIQPGENVRVIGLNGLTLIVEEENSILEN